MKRAVSHVFVDSHPPFSDESNEFLDTPPQKKTDVDNKHPHR